MRVLFAIAHYWRPPGLMRTAATVISRIPIRKVKGLASRFALVHGSLRRDASPRVNALTSCISTIQTLYSRRQYRVDRPAGIARNANELSVAEIDIVVCISDGHHVLDKLPLESGSFHRHQSGLPPKFLSFECQRILASRLGRYDYYCFLEDDTIFHDPWFFQKLNWFNRRFGAGCLLQPNRYDQSLDGPVRKLYGDEVIRKELTQSFQDIDIEGTLAAEFMGFNLQFHRAVNPHSGCYFLTNEQMEFWSNQPGFGEPDDAFVGPLESGASLGIMKTFKVYKPALPNANFLEVEHFGSGHIDLENLNRRCPNSQFRATAPRSLPDPHSQTADQKLARDRNRSEAL